MQRLEGKVIVVAGAGTGIGRATAHRLASEGASIIVGDLSLERADIVATDIRQHGGQAIGLGFDLVDEASVIALLQAAVNHFGGLDGVHINAADLVSHRFDTNVCDIDMAIFDRIVAVNMRGHFLCTRHAIPLLQARGGGALVYTSSAGAFIGEPKRVAYAMTKSATHALMRHVATRWGKENIRANVVAPGMVPTEANNQAPPSRLENALKAHRSPRLGKPEDIAAMVAHLMSPDGEWITGQVISVDGGVTIRQ